MSRHPIETTARADRAASFAYTMPVRLLSIAFDACPARGTKVLVRRIGEFETRDESASFTRDDENKQLVAVGPVHVRQGDTLTIEGSKATWVTVRAVRA